MSLSKKRNIALMASAATILCFNCGAAFAQSATADEGGAVTILQRIVKGAGVDKVAVDTPQAVTVVNQKDLDDAQPTTVGDVFKQVPGANTSGSQRVLGESFVIRGIGSGEDQGDEGRFIISVDGVDKNYQQYRLGGLFTDPELYKRVEVLRGPASSTLYGSGALAGTVLFTTKDASDFLDDGETFAARLKGGYQTNSEETLGSSIFAWRPSENAELLIAGNRRQGFDYQSGNGSEIDADFLSLSGLVKSTFRFGDNNEQVVRASFQRWLTDAENQQYAQTVNSSGFGRVDRNVKDDTYLLSYENPASDNDWLDLKAQISYSDTLNKERNATVFFFGPGPGTQFFPDADFRYKTLQAKVENTVQSDGDNWENFFTFGLQYTHLDRSLALRDTGAQPEGVDEKIGAFVQNEFVYNDSLTITPGLRIDYRTLTPDDSVQSGFAGGATAVDDIGISPKVSALYKLNENWNVFGSYAHTERLPTLDEAFDYRTGAVPGDGLEKERSDNFELGFSYQTQDVISSGDAFQFKATAFHNNIQDYIFRNPFTSDTAPMGQAFINIGDVRLYGLELEMAYESDTWFAKAGAALIRGEDKGNNISDSGNLNTVPPDELFVTLGYKVPSHDLTFSATGRFVADQDDVFGVPVGNLSESRRPSDGFATLDLAFDWKPSGERFKDLELRASVENVFDTQYQEFLANDPARGRTFKLSLIKKFSM